MIKSTERDALLINKLCAHNMYACG